MNIVTVGLTAYRFMKKASPILISAAAGIGAVVTYVLAIKETEEAQDIIQEAAEEEEQGFELAKKLVKVYAPSFILLVITLLCIVQSTIISQHRIRDLTASCAALATFTNEYRRKQIDIYGKETDQKVITEIAKDRFFESHPDDIGDDEILCFMPTYPHWFSVPSVECIINAFTKVNEKMDQTRKPVMLSDFMKWAHATEYDTEGNVKDMDHRYLGYGWECIDLYLNEGVGGVYPFLEKFHEQSGLEGYCIDIPEPKQIELII